MKEHNRNSTQNQDTIYNMVHPQCRGYVHRTVFYSTLYKNHSSHLHTQLQIPSSPQSCAHSCRPLRTQLQIFFITPKPSTHLAVDFLYHPKTLCAHSCRGHPCTQLGLKLLLQNSLSFASIHLTSKS